jgi:hypothetical protein
MNERLRDSDVEPIGIDNRSAGFDIGLAQATNESAAVAGGLQRTAIEVKDAGAAGVADIGCFQCSAIEVVRVGSSAGDSRTADHHAASSTDGCAVVAVEGDGAPLLVEGAIAAGVYGTKHNAATVHDIDLAGAAQVDGTVRGSEYADFQDGAGGGIHVERSTAVVVRAVSESTDSEPLGGIDGAAGLVQDTGAAGEVVVIAGDDGSSRIERAASDIDRCSVAKGRGDLDVGIERIGEGVERADARTRGQGKRAAIDDGFTRIGIACGQDKRADAGLGDRGCACDDGADGQ